MSVLLLILIAAIGVLVLGGLVLSIVLLFFEKTRVIGIVLLALILLGIPVIAGAGAIVFWVDTSGPTQFAVPDEYPRLELVKESKYLPNAGLCSGIRAHFKLGDFRQRLITGLVETSYDIPLSFATNAITGHV